MHSHRTNPIQRRTRLTQMRRAWKKPSQLTNAKLSRLIEVHQPTESTTNGFSDPRQVRHVVLALGVIPFVDGLYREYRPERHGHLRESR